MLRSRSWSLVLLLVCACSSPPSFEVPPASPDARDGRNLTWISRKAIDVLYDLSAWMELQAGYVAMFARDGRVVHATTAGFADRESGRPMALDTRFRMASMSKPVTAVAAMKLVEDGKLGLDDPVAQYIPAAGKLRVASSTEADPNGEIPTVALERPVTVRDLLTFRAGIGSKYDDSDLGRQWALRDIYAGDGSLADRVNRILTAPLYEQPGKTWRYGWSADVLARVVEVAAGQPFGAFVTEQILEPLGMTQTSYLPPEDPPNTASVYTQDEEKNLVRVEHPASDARDWTPGGSGLVSTAGDYMRFALMLWNKGTYDGVQILKPETVEEMTTAHVASGVLANEGIEGMGWGLGLAVVADSDATLPTDRDGDFWWSGYYGTTFFVSPSTGIVGVVLSQNQPGPYSDRPIPVYLGQAAALVGN